jgi:hypothetical protein
MSGDENEFEESKDLVSERSAIVLVVVLVLVLENLVGRGSKI